MCVEPLLCDMELNSVIFNHSLVLCDNTECNDPSHISAIDRLYCDITDSVLCASNDFVKVGRRHNDGQIPGWMEYCSASHAEARQSFLNWVSNGKPRQGFIFDYMKVTKAYFKFTLRQMRLL